jgi:23S rRNA (guanosine2251-2'-O)-methyltransferase
MSDDTSRWLIGFHAVLGALEAGRPADLLWLQDGRRDRRAHQLVEVARGHQVPVRWVARGRLDDIAEGVPHNGCALRCAPLGWRSLDELITEPECPGRLVLLDAALDPHNIGAVVRTSAAFAIDGLIVAGPSAPPLAGAVATAAAGHLDRVPLVRASVAADALRVLRDAGYWCYGAAADGAAVSAIRPINRWVLCVGGEARGVRAKTRSMIDEWLAIPMAPGVESLNLAVASAVLLWELTGRGHRTV